MEYPYIGKLIESVNSCVLFTANGFGCKLSHSVNQWKSVGMHEFTGCWCEEGFKNITREHLTNTYGEVKSKAHAEFIRKLCKVNGISVNEHPSNLDAYFLIDDNVLHYCYSKPIELKQITIPLPPNSNTNTPEEDFEMQQIQKNNGDNLMFGGADKREEWPKVGDKATLSNDEDYTVSHGHEAVGESVLIMSLFNDGEVDMAVVKHGITNYCFRVEMLKKPKTEAEMLRDEVSSILDSYVTGDKTRGYYVDKIIELTTIKPQ